jgi:four helix bundle protein
MCHKNLEIWQLAIDLVIDIHRVTMNLPKFEMYEIGSQIRKSSKSTKSMIVEGYGRRYYKQEFIKFLIYSIASNDETIDHLETLYETRSLQYENVFNDLHIGLEILGKKINNFIQFVKQGHISEK